MKTVTIPFVPQLDYFSFSDMPIALEVRAARLSIDSLNWPAAFPYKPIATVDIARSHTALYLHYFVRSLQLRAHTVCDGQQVYEDSCVEFFMRRADWPSSRYINFEFNCIGACYASRHESRHEATPLTADELRRIRRRSSLPFKAIPTEGGIQTWELTVAIPFDLMELDGNQLPDAIRANFYKCADGTGLPHYTSWNPIDLPAPNFHCPEFFGEIRF